MITKEQFEGEVDKLKNLQTEKLKKIEEEIDKTIMANIAQLNAQLNAEFKVRLSVEVPKQLLFIVRDAYLKNGYTILHPQRDVVDGGVYDELYIQLTPPKGYGCSAWD